MFPDDPMADDEMLCLAKEQMVVFFAGKANV